jgi:hypothetical protein
MRLLIPVAARSEASVCRRSLAWVSGSNSAGGRLAAENVKKCADNK